MLWVSAWVLKLPGHITDTNHKCSCKRHYSCVLIPYLVPFYIVSSRSARASWLISWVWWATFRVSTLTIFTVSICARARAHVCDELVNGITAIYYIDISNCKQLKELMALVSRWVVIVVCRYGLQPYYFNNILSMSATGMTKLVITTLSVLYIIATCYLGSPFCTYK